MAVGAEEPLAEHMMVADFFRELAFYCEMDNGLTLGGLDGIDGLGGIHHSVRWSFFFLLPP